MDVDLLSVAQYRGSQPHDAFRWLREHDPVHFHAELGDKPGFWAVTRYDDVRAVGRNPGLFSSSPTTMLDDPGPGSGSLFGDSVMMLMADPPLHTKMRRLVSREFTPRVVEQLRPGIRDIANRIVDSVAASGRCELVSQVAGEMPTWVISDMLGIPVDDGRRLYHHTEAIHSSGESVSSDDRRNAVMAMYTYAQQAFADKLATPGDDLASRLANGSLEGRDHNETDFFLWFLLLIDAGGDTTRNLIGAGTHALLAHPEQLAWLVDDLDGRLGTAIEELLRWVSPVVYMRRTATEDTELGGKQITAGDKVVMYYGSANRDPAVFDRPDELDLSRTPNPHIAFGGGGPHFCLGAHLARIEVEEMFRALLSRLSDMAVNGPVTWMDSNFVFGPTSLPVTFSGA